VSAFYHTSYLWRPPEEVAEEIALIGNDKTVFLIDDNIVANPDAAKALFQALIPLKIRWVGQASIDFVEDEELAALMVKSGCLGLVIGFESLEKNNLLQMKKEWNLDSDGYERAIQKLRKHGLMIWAAFLFGYDYDTGDIFKASFDFARKHRFAFFATNHLMPYPGTAVYDRLAEEGRLLYTKWWDDPDYRFGQIVFQPKRMSLDDLAKGSLEIRKKLYSYRMIFRRWLDTKNNCKNLFNAAVTLRYNLLFRREMYKKQHLRLGGAVFSERFLA
jgi:radical SAM superfamily enzyme YgiQ (UPF0313 family)